ncbi:hypothetical protein HMPREF0724_11102 [Prescottella equi ATCC 33707]|uniref:Uncharacterized protein n=1 Tax=Prescottella equi ATCC 33707 TaxID=525370 RepID=E9SXN7_RHOHA|nr:hypothetical protein HMPREF0724_11102 [Prescottella equi ATCC 33707]
MRVAHRAVAPLRWARRTLQALDYEWLGDDSLIDNLGCRNRSLGGGRWCDRRCRRWRLGSGGSRR